MGLGERRGPESGSVPLAETDHSGRHYYCGHGGPCDSDAGGQIERIKNVPKIGSFTTDV